MTIPHLKPLNKSHEAGSAPTLSLGRGFGGEEAIPSPTLGGRLGWGVPPKLIASPFLARKGEREVVEDFPNIPELLPLSL